MVKASKVENFESIENARSWWCLLPNTAWFIRNLLLPSLWTVEISAVHTRLPWEAFLIFWDLQIKSQSYIQDFLARLSSFFGIHKSNPNRTYKTSLRSFPHFLGSTNRIPTVHTRLSWKAFLIFGIQLQIKSQPYIQDFLEKISSSLRSIYKSDLNHTGMTSFRIFHQPWSSLLKSLSCISQKCWNHFHVFHRRVGSQNHCWNHFHIFHKNIVEITFMYFTQKKNHCWNHFHVFHKNVEITFMYFTKKN
jgi:hypothetical protein